MHHISLSYSLDADTSGPLIRNPLIDLLQAVRASGSISGAATLLDLSYRHVWGELRRWEERLGQPLRLSMGMSEDLEAAIAAGSDQVRIGTALFGERPIRT